MPSTSHALRYSLVLLLCVATASLAQTATPKADAKTEKKAIAKGDPKAKGGHTQLSTEQTFSNFGQMVRMGTPMKGVTIPSFEEGKATSLVKADVLTRTSENALFAEGMVIETYAADPKENLTVKLITADYDLQKKMLISNQRSRVERADFSIEGDSMIYDTTNSSGKMVGRVVMIINDAGTVTAGPKPAASKAPADSKEAPTPAPANSAPTPATK
jgi:hypothetical protein